LRQTPAAPHPYNQITRLESQIPARFHFRRLKRWMNQRPGYHLADTQLPGGGHHSSNEIVDPNTGIVAVMFDREALIRLPALNHSPHPRVTGEPSQVRHRAHAAWKGAGSLLQPQQPARGRAAFQYS
jgi:hypothetical protein